MQNQSNRPSADAIASRDELTIYHTNEKTRIQISPEYAALGMGGTVKRVVGSEGVLAMWKGVNAGESNFTF
jgi:hypothetical protein